MPLIKKSTYKPPALLRNGHANTLYAGCLRKAPRCLFHRERVPTPDGDFLDIDWLAPYEGQVSNSRPERVAVLSHGLEGDSSRAYIRGMAECLARRGWTVAAWNFRGCSGEPNRNFRLYHSGSSDDLDTVVQHAVRTRRPRSLALVGFSLGGNVTLKYTGEQGASGVDCLRAAVEIGRAHV